MLNRIFLQMFCYQILPWVRNIYKANHPDLFHWSKIQETEYLKSDLHFCLILTNAILKNSHLWSCNRMHLHNEKISEQENAAMREQPGNQIVSEQPYANQVMQEEPKFDPVANQPAK